MLLTKSQHSPKENRHVFRSLRLGPDPAIPECILSLSVQLSRSETLTCYIRHYQILFLCLLVSLVSCPTLSPSLLQLPWQAVSPTDPNSALQTTRLHLLWL